MSDWKAWGKEEEMMMMGRRDKKRVEGSEMSIGDDGRGC
jgi:hypothetical protein